MLLANAIYQNIEKGGPIMGAILLALVVALVIVVDRSIWWLRQARRVKREAVERALHAVGHGDAAEALSIAAGADCPHLGVIAAGLRHNHDKADLAMRLRADEELAAAERAFWLLGTVITLAPLLGLLGTVTGIMSAFDFGADPTNASAKVTAGIAEALIATAWGLGIAIAGVVCHGYFRRRTAKLRAALDRTAKKFLVAREDAKHPALRAEFAMAEATATVPGAAPGDTRAPAPRTAH